MSKWATWWLASDAHQKLADAASAVSAGGAAVAWLGTANDILTLIATLVAIVAGGYAIAIHRKKLKGLSNETKSSSKAVHK